MERGRRAGPAVLALPWPGARPFALDPPALGAWLGHAFAREAEARRLFPWIAVAYGAGILAAFAADGPLSPWPPALAAGAAAGAAFALRGRVVAFAACVVATALLLGFLATVLRLGRVDAPILARPSFSSVSGFVETVEERAGGGGRFVVLVHAMDRVEPGAQPRRVRVSVRQRGSIAPGDFVRATARLLPLPEAARPGGYDFARDAFFRGIGAVGSFSGRPARLDPPPVEPPLGLRLAAAVDRARNAVTARIAGTIGGQAGAVAAALVTGKRGLIDEATNDSLRAAGIYHVVSISGLHMVLAAGAVFFVVRALLALSPTLALRWPCKKIAAVAGMAGAAAYDVFSGSDVATERSLAMILVMQGAILFDRPALSLRNLALSALVILTLEPEALLGPSFQMSYAAVAGLVTLAEWHRSRGPAGPEGPFGRALRAVRAAIVGTVLTTLVASLATGPFGTFHFQNLQPYGVLGNAVTLPLVSLVVMPGAVLGMLALPFGLDRPVWTVMGWAVSGVISLSDWVAALSGSIVVVPAFGVGGLGLLAAGLLVGTLFGSGLRWLAILPIAGGLAAAALHERPDVYVARDGTGAAIRGRDGGLVLVGRVSAFTAAQWLKADGDGRVPTAPALRAAARCDPLGCTVALPDGRVAAFSDKPGGLDQDCRRAALVVTRFAAPPGCRAALVVDRGRLAASGALALRAVPGGWTETAVRRADETRPWFVRRTPPAPATPRPSSPPEEADDPPPAPPDEGGSDQ